MLTALLLGGITTMISMAIQVMAVVMMVRYLSGLQTQPRWKENTSFTFDTLVLITVLLVLFAGHLIQITIWALLFIQLNEFTVLQTALYHSAVNFTSLGYGDLVMSERWRLLGPLETANGVLMFSLSAAAIFSTMSRLFRRHISAAEKTGE